MHIPRIPRLVRRTALIGLVAWVSAGGASGQNYVLEYDIFDAGGGAAGGGPYQLVDSLQAGGAAPGLGQFGPNDDTFPTSILQRLPHP